MSEMIRVVVMVLLMGSVSCTALFSLFPHLHLPCMCPFFHLLSLILLLPPSPLVSSWHIFLQFSTSVLPLLLYDKPHPSPLILTPFTLSPSSFHFFSFKIFFPLQLSGPQHLLPPPESRLLYPLPHPIFPLTTFSNSDPQVPFPHALPFCPFLSFTVKENSLHPDLHPTPLLLAPSQTPSLFSLHCHVVKSCRWWGQLELKNYSHYFWPFAETKSCRHIS